MLLRFAGTRLAAGDDDLTPTALRRGGRTLGGALSWETPKHIAAFDKESPFFGLAAPRRSDDFAPGAGRAGAGPRRTRPGRGSPTARRWSPPTPRGKGLIVLFHVTADTTWSNLPLSGLFVDMLRRIVARAGPAPAETSGRRKGGRRRRAAPYRTLDGFGALGAPPADAAPIAGDFAGPGDARHPPGFYGPADALASGQRAGAGRGAGAGGLRRL